MRSTASRLTAAVLVALVAWLALAAATSSRGGTAHPDKLIILSTTDVKGKTSPCG